MDMKWILHVAKFCQAARAAENAYVVNQARRRPNIVQFGWLPLSDVADVTKPKRETCWDLLGSPKLSNGLAV